MAEIGCKNHRPLLVLVVLAVLAIVAAAENTDDSQEANDMMIRIQDLVNGAVDKITKRLDRLEEGMSGCGQTSAVDKITKRLDRQEEGMSGCGQTNTVSGPYGNIWSDDQCSNAGTILGRLSLSGCISMCEKTSGCTAINYRPQNTSLDEPGETDCVLRACTLPVPVPEFNSQHYQGYALFTDCPLGLIMSNGQCYKILKDVAVTWSEAKSKCEAEGLTITQPSDFINAVTLRKQLLDTYGVGRVWLDGRGDGSKHVSSEETELSNDSPLWYPGYPNKGNSVGGITSDDCLVLLVEPDDFNHHPGRPYATNPCSAPMFPHYTLCKERN